MTNNKFWLKSKSKAFTLIELLVVIAIIGVLVTIAIFALGNVRAKSRDAKRVADVKQIQTALELYFNDRGTYPTEDEFASGSLYSTSSGNAVVYMAQVPDAPLPPDGTCTPDDNNYHYLRSTNGANYRLDFCTGGTVGSLTGGLMAGTPGGFIELAQVYLVDQALAGVRVIEADDNFYFGTKPQVLEEQHKTRGMEGARLINTVNAAEVPLDEVRRERQMKLKLESEVMPFTTSSGKANFRKGAKRLAFLMADNTIEIGQLETKYLAEDSIATLPQLDEGLKLIAKTGERRAVTEVLKNDPRAAERLLAVKIVLAAITDERDTKRMRINSEKSDLLKQIVITNAGRERISLNAAFPDVAAAAKSLEAIKKSYPDTRILTASEATDSLLRVDEDVVTGIYGKTLDIAIYREENPTGGSTTPTCDDKTKLCGFVKCGEGKTTYNGQSYETVNICDKEGKNCQCWMKQNLNVGKMISKYGDRPSDPKALEKYCPSEADAGTASVEAKCTSLGALYTFSEALGLSNVCFDKKYTACNDFGCKAEDDSCSFNYPVQGICPEGWHIPSSRDFGLLTFNSNGSCDLRVTNSCSTGYLLKEAGITHWRSETCNNAICNTTKFTALPYGAVDFVNGNIWTNKEGETGLLLSTSFFEDNPANNALFIPRMYGGKPDINITKLPPFSGALGVRCIKDNVEYLYKLTMDPITNTEVQKKFSQALASATNMSIAKAEAIAKSTLKPTLVFDRISMEMTKKLQEVIKNDSGIELFATLMSGAAAK